MRLPIPEEGTAVFGADWDKRVQGPATEARAQKLEGLAAQVRTRLGEPEWRRLTRLVHTCSAAAVGIDVALMVTFFLVLIVVRRWILAVVAACFGPRTWDSVRSSPPDLISSGVGLMVVVAVGVVCAVSELTASAALRRGLRRHAEGGGDIRALEEALWAGYSVRRIRRRLALEGAAGRGQGPAGAGDEHGAPVVAGRGLGRLPRVVAVRRFLARLAYLPLALPEHVLESIGVTTAVGLVFRLILLAVQRGRSTGASDRLETMRFYWWWARGWLPAVLALMPGVVYWVVAR